MEEPGMPRGWPPTAEVRDGISPSQLLSVGAGAGFLDL